MLLTRRNRRVLVNKLEIEKMSKTQRSVNTLFIACLSISFRPGMIPDSFSRSLGKKSPSLLCHWKYKKLISRWDRQTLCGNFNHRLNLAVVVKLCYPRSLLNFPVKFAYLIGESRLFQRMVTFLITAPYKYFYLLTYWLVFCW